MTEELLEAHLEMWSSVNPKQAILLRYYPCEEDDAPGGSPEEAAEWFASLDLADIKVLYVYGVGHGHYYDAAKEWLHANQERHLVFLEDELCALKRLFESEKATAILKDPQVQLHYFRDLKDHEAILEVTYWDFLTTKVGVSALKHYAETRPKQLEDLQHKILFDTASKNALVDEYLKYGVGFFKNFYPNMHTLADSYWGNHLFGQFKGIPAIICGAGPSLSKSFPLLKELKKRAIIFGGGSAVNALGSAGIHPHFGAGIDPNPEQYARLTQSRAKGIPYFYRNRMYHDAYMAISGKKLYVSGSGGYDVSDWYEEKFGLQADFLDEGHNVVNFCTEVATRLGCNPIIFVGVDLAYTELQSYAPGVITDVSVDAQKLLTEEDIDERGIERKDIYGQPIYTLWKWIAESEWLGDYAQEHPQTTYYNATEGGLGFPPVPNIALKEAVDRFCTEEYDLDTQIATAIQQAAMPQVTHEKVHAYSMELRDSLKRCQEHLKTLIEEAGVIKERIQKEGKLPNIMQTGLAALAETELAEEPAYEAVLDIFNVVYSRVLNHDLKKLRHEGDEVNRAVQKLEINNRKLTFLGQVADVNIQLIEKAFGDEV